METSKELRWIRILLTIIALPIVVLILKTLKAIFIPLIFAIFLTFVFAPLTSYLKKKHVPLWLIILITLIIIAGVFSIVVMILYAASNSLISGLPKYQERFQNLVVDGAAMLEGLSARMDVASKSFPLLDLNTLLSGSTFSLTNAIKNTMNSLMAVMWNLFLILIFMIFMLLEADKFEPRLTKDMSPESRDKTTGSFKTMQKQIQNYLTVKTLISFVTSLIGMGLMLIYGVDFVLVCGILLFCLNYIPNIGSVLASGIPILILFLQYGLCYQLALFSILIVATQMFFGNILEPRLQGNRLNLTPIIVLISLIFWGWLWGFVGLLICVPLTSAINIILKQVDQDNMFSALISS
ncbi:MAG: AI-2E family transporter [Candidatus Cloacimonetes bacterium HGW-Cloacimonetes-3]|nr:MAG: AI-2E family transporter [Candidatus Cloacimonetes bacterium HGW-Cloacimonetes-3]